MACEQNESLVGVYNLIIPQGSDTSVNLTYKVAGSVVDLSSYTAKLQVRDTYGGDLKLEITSDDNEIILDSTAPNIIVKFPNAKTTAMTSYEGMMYDLEITSPADIVTRVIQGTFKLDREITT